MNDNQLSHRELIQQWITAPLPSLLLVDSSPRQVTTQAEATIVERDREQYESTERS